MSSAKRTHDHEEIRRWVEQHGGRPATVKGTQGQRGRGRKGESAGLLRIDFPGYSGEESLEEISWDDFFQKFDEEELDFLYQDRKNSRFNKLVSRHGREEE